MNCQNCQCFIQRDPDQGLGECHLHPPHLFLVPVPGTLGGNQLTPGSAWPIVNQNQWCFEHKPKVEN